jgi:uncharacterized membrane protein YraQ (UPF0718 family)
MEAMPATAPPLELELRAQLNGQHFRGLKLASLRWLAASSLPAWLQVCHPGALPGFLAWTAVLAQGYCVAMSVAYAALEYHWARRGADFAAGPSEVVVHAVWTVWDELRTALWYVMAAVALVPWLYAAFDRPVAASLLAGLFATAWMVLVLLAATEVLAARRRSPGRAPRAAGPGR